MENINNVNNGKTAVDEVNTPLSPKVTVSSKTKDDEHLSAEQNTTSVWKSRLRHSSGKPPRPPKSTPKAKSAKTTTVATPTSKRKSGNNKSIKERKPTPNPNSTLESDFNRSDIRHFLSPKALNCSLFDQQFVTPAGATQRQLFPAGAASVLSLTENKFNTTDICSGISVNSVNSVSNDESRTTGLLSSEISSLTEAINTDFSKGEACRSLFGIITNGQMEMHNQQIGEVNVPMAEEIEQEISTGSEVQKNTNSPKIPTVPEQNSAGNPSNVPPQQDVQDDEVVALLAEIKQLEQNLKAAKEGSVEKMFTDLRLDMKKDSLRVMQRIRISNVETSKLSANVASLQSKYDELDRKVDNVQDTCQEAVNSQKSNLLSLTEVSDKVTVLQGIVKKQAQQLALLQENNEEKEMRSMANNVIISGLEECEEEDPASLREIVTDFFSQTMKIPKQVNIVKVRRIGSTVPRNIIVTVTNVSERNFILKHGKNLKDLKNTNDMPYFINEQLPLAMQEWKRKIRDIKKTNRDLSTDDQLSITSQKGDIVVNNQKYEDPLKPPNVKEVVSPEDRKRIAGKNLVHGETQRNGNCLFIGYSMEIKDIEDVRAGYAEVMRLNPDALHVCCSYRLPGRNFVRLQNYHDNGEAGGGRTIFNMMKHSKMWNRALFVVRYYGNKHLGNSRFATMAAAVKSVVARSSFNKTIGKNQFIEEQTENRPMGYVP